MASLVFTPFKEQVMEGVFNLLEGQDDIKNLLAMTNTTAGVEENDEFVSQITTLDENDGSGYTGGHGGAGRRSLASQTVTPDNTNWRGVFDAADETWTALGAGTRALDGDIIHRVGTSDDTTAKLIAWVEFASDVTLNGGDFTIQWHADGIMYLG